jgi:pimeloyl-ACP methyl ester carboxylesterase
MPEIKTDRITIAYDSFGTASDEPLLLIAGLGTQMLRWTPDFCSALAARGFRVIRFDNRDAGLSTNFADCPMPDFAALAAGKAVEVPYTLDDMASDALALLDALEIDRAHIVGRSMGGMIAQVIASSHPDRALSLTAIMSSTGNRALPQAAPDVMAMMMGPSPVPSENLDGYLIHALAFARRIAGPGYPFDADAQRAIVLAELERSHGSGGLMRQIAAIAVTGDVRPRLASITAPTLVIHGADDPLIPPAAGADIAASIADARLMMIEGMGHDLPVPLYGTVIDAIVENAQRSGANDR